MGKREEKKQMIREKILKGAVKVFSEKDFEQATMQMVAEAAGVGLGTAYNYFPSKEELFLLTLADHAVSWQLPKLEKETEIDTSKLITDMVLSQVYMFKKFSKKTWKSVLGVSFSAMRKNQSLLKRLMEADLKAMEKLGLAIDSLKKSNLVHIKEDTDVLVDLIYGNLFLQLVMYVYSDEMAFEEVCEKIRKAVGHVLRENT